MLGQGLFRKNHLVLMALPPLQPLGLGDTPASGAPWLPRPPRLRGRLSTQSVGSVCLCTALLCLRSQKASCPSF